MITRMFICDGKMLIGNTLKVIKNARLGRDGGGDSESGIGSVQNVAQDQRLEPEGSWFSVGGSKLSWMQGTQKPQPNKISSSPHCKLTRISAIRPGIRRYFQKSSQVVFIFFFFHYHVYVYTCVWGWVVVHVESWDWCWESSYSVRQRLSVKPRAR